MSFLKNIFTNSPVRLESAAAQRCRKAADQGDAQAQFYVGWMYNNGQGGPEDYAEVRMWCRKAADQGDARAQCNLGMMYHEGEGVPQDYAQAMMWWRKAADQGVAAAQNMVATAEAYHRTMRRQ